MTWARASKSDYAALESLGNEGWSWEGWLPYFLKSERMHPSGADAGEALLDLASFDVREGIHSMEGAVRLGFVPWLGETHRPFFRSLERLGVPSNPASVCLSLTSLPPSHILLSSCRLSSFVSPSLSLFGVRANN